MERSEIEEQLHRARVREIIRSALRTEKALKERLAVIEPRLGTALEGKGDLEESVHISHRLKSVWCVTNLAEEYGVTR